MGNPEPCGCRIDADYPHDTFRIVFCRVHIKAPKMAVALAHALERLHSWAESEGWLDTFDEVDTVKEIRNLLSRGWHT